MAWFRGKDVELYVSTENSSYGISQSGDDAAAQAWGGASLIADFIIAPLKTDSGWVGTETDATGSFPARATAFDSVEGIELNPDAEREDIDLLGRKVQDSIRLRQIFEVTVVRKMSGPAWALIYNQADKGLDSSNALNPADDETSADSGFRLFVKVANTDDSLWFTGRNCTMTKYSISTPPVKTVFESLTFRSNLYDVGTQSYTTATTDSEL